MKYTRVLIAKVALGVGTEDEVFWLSKSGNAHLVDVKNLQALAGLPTTPSCVGDAELIQIADENKMSRVAQDHILSCARCARIGQYIANMDNPSSFEVKSLAG